LKLLIIEDEKELNDSILAYLKEEHYLCEFAFDFKTAIEKISLYDYDCLLLDISLPDGSGLDILKELRNNKKIDGVIITSARNALDDKIKALHLGADDYLTKPFHLSELSARISAIIRRKNFSGIDIISAGNIEINTSAKSAKVNNAEVPLTKKEYELLLYFISNKNKVISKNAIAEHLWGDDMDLADNYDFIYTHIKNLRQKLFLAEKHEYIKSVYGMGYKFVAT
jgi:DNA-binding response OmpR family regulator